MFFKKYHGYLCALLFERGRTFLRYLRGMVVCFFSRAFVTFVGKEPEDKDTPMMERVSGPTISENTSLRNVVAIMSNWQVDDVRRWVISLEFDRKMSSK